MVSSPGRSDHVGARARRNSYHDAQAGKNLARDSRRPEHAPAMRTDTERTHRGTRAIRCSRFGVASRSVAGPKSQQILTRCVLHCVALASAPPPLRRWPSGAWARCACPPGRAGISRVLDVFFWVLFAPPQRCGLDASRLVRPFLLGHEPSSTAKSLTRRPEGGNCPAGPPKTITGSPAPTSLVPCCTATGRSAGGCLPARENPTAASRVGYRSPTRARASVTAIHRDNQQARPRS